MFKGLIINVKRKEFDLLQMKVIEIYTDGQNFLIFIESCFWGCYVMSTGKYEGHSKINLRLVGKNKCVVKASKHMISSNK